MLQSSILNLADCSEFRQAVQARPPRIVHGAAMLIIALVAAAITWASLTKADLVVRAPGRMRPVSTPQRVMATFRGEVLTGGAGASVREVNFREGASVKQGDLLLTLDTERLDNEIERMRQRISSCEEELRKGVRMADLLRQQCESTRARIEAELSQATEEIRVARQRRQSELRLAEAELQHARDDEAMKRRLTEHRVVARVDWEQALLKVRDAGEKLAQAKLPIDDGKLEVLRRSLASLEKDCTIKLAELEVKQQAKQSEAEANRLELANLQLERSQAAIRAPISGVVTTGDIKPGDALEPGKPVLEIAEQAGFRFEIAVPAREMEDVHIGMPVRIRLDAYDYQRYGTAEGTVDYISADSKVNQEGGSIYYVAKVTVDARELRRGDLRGPLKLGLTGQAEIVTGRETLLSLLLRKIRRTISLG